MLHTKTQLAVYIYILFIYTRSACSLLLHLHEKPCRFTYNSYAKEDTNYGTHTQNSEKHMQIKLHDQ